MPTLKNKQDNLALHNTDSLIRHIYAFLKPIAPKATHFTPARILCAISVLICLITIICCETFAAPPTLTIDSIVGTSGTLTVNYTTTADYATSDLTTANWKYSRDGSTQKFPK